MPIFVGDRVALKQNGVGGPGAPGPMPPVIGRVSSILGALHFVKWETGTQTAVVSGPPGNLDLIGDTDAAGLALLGRVVRPVPPGGGYISNNLTGPIVRAYTRDTDGGGSPSQFVVIKTQCGPYFELAQGSVTLVEGQ